MNQIETDSLPVNPPSGTAARVWWMEFKCPPGFALPINYYFHMNITSRMCFAFISVKRLTQNLSRREIVINGWQGIYIMRSGAREPLPWAISTWPGGVEDLFLFYTF